MFVDFSFIEIVNDYMNNQKYNTASTFDQMFNKLSKLSAFDKMINFYDFAFSKNEYKEALKSVLLDMKFESSNDMANMLFTNLLRIKDSNLINQKLEIYKQYDFSRTQKNLESSIPGKCDTEMEIYFVYDGINGGSIVGDNQMMINFMLWPSNQRHLGAIEGILLHEAHHLGMIEIYSKNGLYQQGKKDNNILRRLVVAIVSEGIATYLFNQNNSLGDLIVESHGIEFANQYRESENVKEHEITKLIAKLNHDFRLIRGKSNYESNVKYLEEYCCNYDGGQPLDKAIGVYICKLLDENIGRERLIELLANPNLLINEYNKLVSNIVQIELQEEDMVS